MYIIIVFIRARQNGCVHFSSLDRKRFKRLFERSVNHTLGMTTQKSNKFPINCIFVSVSLCHFFAFMLVSASNALFAFFRQKWCVNVQELI